MEQRQTILGSLNEWPAQAVEALQLWECQGLDRLVADMFGFHALQLGQPELDALRCNRMPHRWLGLHPNGGEVQSTDRPEDSAAVDRPGGRSRVLLCDFDALPFPSQSLDLVVLVHALESARDPHLALREVERVLVPEGRAIVVGFNPASLWGLRRRTWAGDDGSTWIGYGRLRDWMKLLGFEVDSARFGMFRPPLSRAAWLRRLNWLEPVGERWWPLLGAVYMVAAVKRVRGMRLVGLSRRQARYASAPRPVAVSRQHRDAPPATP